MRLTAHAILISLTVACLPGGGQASPYKEIRDTVVSCTNGLTCDIMLKVLTEQAKLYAINIHRASAVDAPVELKIRVNEKAKAGSEFVLMVDGTEAVRFAADELAYDPDWYEYSPKDADAGRALFGLLKNAASLSVSFETDAAGKTDFSLSGLAGAGLYLDEVQGRLDARDALVRVGDKVTPEPLSRDIASFADLPAALRPDFESAEASCGFVDPNRFRYGQGFATRLEDGVEMFVLPCSEGGAYNQPYAVYQNLSGIVSQVQLPSMSEEGPTTEGYATNVDWDPQTKTLVSFDKGRGLGDCGVLQKWVLRDGIGAVSFALKEMRVKDNCDGVEDDGPDSWPLVWPVK